MLRHAERDFGRTGFREVRLEVFNGGSLAYSYDLCHVWRVADGQCSSIFYLSEPRALAGTAVLAVERPNVEEMLIWLRLRTAGHPLRLDPSRSRQFVLGTDFTYEDLRFWLPMQALEVNTVSFHSRDGHDVCTVRAARSSAYAQDPDIRMDLDAEHWLPLLIHWFDGLSARPLKVYRAERHQQVDGIWTPTIMSVARPLDRYLSVMTLRRACHNLAVDRSIFDPESLADLSTEAFDRWRRSSTDLSLIHRLGPEATA